jgi:hypothetical protein
MHYYLVPILVLTVDGYFLINLLSAPVTNILLCQSQSLLCTLYIMCDAYYNPFSYAYHVSDAFTMCTNNYLRFCVVNNSKYVKQLT